MLSNRHRDAVYLQMLKVCGNATDAEDALQDALLKAFRFSSQLRDPGQFQAWLASIARNVCTRLKIREALQPITDLPLNSPSGRPLPDAQVIINDLHATVNSAIGRLPDIYREAVQYKIIDNLTTEEAAKKSGTTISTFKARFQRGRKLLRTMLDNEFF